MDSKMFKVERNTAIPGGIDDLLASFSWIVVFSVTVKLAILVWRQIVSSFYSLTSSAYDWVLFSAVRLHFRLTENVFL